MLKEEIRRICCTHLGIESPNTINDWISKSHNGGYWIKSLTEVSDFLMANKNTPILICGDYDVDGDCSIAILWLMFKEAGFTNVKYRAPRRFTEGFGLNEAMVDEADEGIIITCDNGIAASKAIQKAKDKGLSVIITDHHLPIIENGEKLLPNADFIIDPNALENSAEFSGYCGAGICYKLAIGLLGKENPIIPKLQTLAACATIADVMELREENFVIVREGLSKMADRETTLGLAALLDEFKIEVPQADDIGFRIGPALNAPGRLIDNGSLWSVALLICENKEEAKKIAKRLHNINERRKELVEEGMKKVESSINEADTFKVLYANGISEGIIGILAGQITEKTGYPSIVFTDSANDELKGSGRSNSIDLKECLDKIPNDFIKYGGHSGAAGLSIRKEDLVKVRNDLNKLTKGLVAKAINKTEFDLVITEDEILEAYEELSMFAPFGQGNEPIKFKVIGYDKAEEKNLGRGIKYTSKKGTVALAFETEMEAELYGTLSVNTFKGKSEIQIMVA